MNELIINASHILGLANHPLYFLFCRFLEKFDTEKIDVIIEELMENLEDKDLEDFFNYTTRIYYYLSVLVNTKVNDVLSFKVDKAYITNEKIMLRIKYTQL
jgi:hypothetical protein